MPTAVLGNNCSIGQGCFIADRVVMGNGCRIQNGVSIYEGVVLGDDVFVGPGAVFTNVRRPRTTYPVDHVYAKTWVKTGATIGAHATIVCDVSVGKHSLVGAGAVVVRDVPDYAVAVGVPARTTSWICVCGRDLSVIAQTCECGRSFGSDGETIWEVG